MDKSLRRAALDALLNGGEYRDVVETQVTMNALDAAQEIHLHVPIRFRLRYEEMSDQHRSDPGPEEHESAS